MKNNNTTPKKRLFGRNIFTLVVAAFSILIVFLGIFITSQYVTTYNKNNITPFVTKKVGENFEENVYDLNNVVRMNGKDFDKLGVILKCTKFTDEETTKQATYELRLYSLENSKTVSTSVTANICFANDWVGYATYSSKSSTIKVAKDEAEALEKSTYRKTFTLNSFGEYPTKTDTWPIKISVDKPTIYLYLSYKYYENGTEKTENYILKYSYDELIPEVGGIKR